MILAMSSHKPSDESLTPFVRRRSGVVIPITSGERRQASSAPRETSTEPISQARLARILELYLEEMKVAQTLREMRIKLDTELAGGSEIESGDLTFDRELQIVRRKPSSAAAD
jgi:hypothetical protein